MTRPASSELISAISEIVTTLNMPLRQLIEKEFKELMVLSKYLPNSEENIQSLTSCCLYKAKGCKQIELDFLNSFDRNLNPKLEIIQIKLAKRYAINLGNCDSHSEIKSPILLDYNSIIRFLQRLFNETKLNTNNTVKEKSLDLVSLSLENKTSPLSDKCTGNLEALFSYILTLIKREYSAEANALYVKKINNLEETEFFSQLSRETKISFYTLIYEIDGLILYRVLLENLVLLVKQAFQDDLALIAFISVFITQFMQQYDVTKNDFDSIIVLLYLALYQKQKVLLIDIDVGNTWLSNLGSKIRERVADKPNQLSQFNASYQQKTATNLELTIKKFSFGGFQGPRIFSENAINPQITSWFLLENINRSSSNVKEAFSSALASASHYFNPNYEGFPDKGIKKGFMKGIVLLKTKYAENKEQFREIIEQFSNSVQEKTSYQNSLQKEDLQTVSLTSLRERLQKIKDELGEYAKTIHFIFFSINSKAPLFTFKNNSLGGVAFNASVTSEENHLRLKLEIETLEQIARNFVRENCPIVLLKRLLNMILDIKKERFWFQASGLSFLAFIERGFKRGYFFNKQVKLCKLKARLAKKISFEEEKHFLYSQSFFSLLRFGIIRWFWIDKGAFAKHWAEQLVLLKVVDTIAERGYEQLLKTNVVSEGIINEAELGCELSELYQQVMSVREKNWSIGPPFPTLSQDIESLNAKIERLVAEMTSCVSQSTEACSLLEVKSVSANSRKFFNNTKNQIGKVGLLSAHSVLNIIN